jgi:hypothetical protein
MISGSMYLEDKDDLERIGFMGVLWNQVGGEIKVLAS